LEVIQKQRLFNEKIKLIKLEFLKKTITKSHIEIKGIGTE
jgi:hypothetical protein